MPRHAIPLADKQREMKKRNRTNRALVKLQRAKTKLTLRESAKIAKALAKEIALRDHYLDVLKELRDIRARAQRSIDHLRRPRERALRRSAGYAYECGREIEKIDSLREIGEMP